MISSFLGLLLIVMTSIQYDGYSVLYSTELQHAVLTQHVICGYLLEKEPYERSSFHYDDSIPDSFEISSASYTHTGFDRGHLVPFRDLAYDSLLGYSTFNMTNIVPQYPRFNRRLWKMAEEECRQLATAYNLCLVTNIIPEDSIWNIKWFAKVCYIPSIDSTIIWLFNHINDSDVDIDTCKITGYHVYKLFYEEDSPLIVYQQYLDIPKQIFQFPSLQMLERILR